MFVICFISTKSRASVLTNGTEKSILCKLLARTPIRIFNKDIDIYGETLLLLNLVVIKIKEDINVTDHINIKC